MAVGFCFCFCVFVWGIFLFVFCCSFFFFFGGGGVGGWALLPIIVPVTEVFVHVFALHYFLLFVASIVFILNLNAESLPGLYLAYSSPEGFLSCPLSTAWKLAFSKDYYFISFCIVLDAGRWTRCCLALETRLHN